MNDTELTLRRWWRRQKHLYCRRYKKSSLISVLLLLVGLYLIYTYVLSHSLRYTTYYVDPHHIHLPARNSMTDKEILQYQRALVDQRYTQCKQKKYSTKQVKASFLMYYRDKDFNLLKLALSSLVEFTPKSALYEIIIIDDFTEDIQVQKDVKIFMAKEQFEGLNIKTLRSTTKGNYAVAWAKAARKATGELLFFIDNDVIFNVGWYEPLIEFLVHNPEAIAVPRVDAMLPTARFFGFTENYVNVFSWKLSILHYNMNYANDTATAPVPVFRGDLFALSKNLYNSLGGIDESFSSGEGAELELALRTWLCGGTINLVKCSRIAVHNVLSPRDIQLPYTSDRITRLWMKDYEAIVKKQSKQPIVLTDEDIRTIENRKKAIKSSRGRQCNTFDWYLTNVAPMIKVPSPEWTELGKIRDDSGYCLAVSLNDRDIEVILCNPALYQPHMIFEYTARNQILLQNQCLTGGTENKVSLSDCKDTADDAQHWDITYNGFIKSKSQGLCLEHVRHYINNAMVHQVTLKACDNDVNTQKWTFISY